MGRLGFGLCTCKADSASFMSSVYLRLCKQFVRADEENIAARQSWLEKRDRKAGNDK